jgi:hypothetical protein
MYPMKITPEEYAQYFAPAPDILVVKRYLVDYSKVGRIAIPGTVQQASMRFVTVGKVLAVSAHESETEWIEYMKEEIRKSKYVGFASHIIAECPMLPQFELPSDVSIGLLHVRDVTQILNNFEELLERHKEHEKKMTEEHGVAIEPSRLILKGE